jgi:hypothetical protein
MAKTVRTQTQGAQPLRNFLTDVEVRRGTMSTGLFGRLGQRGEKTPPSELSKRLVRGSATRPARLGGTRSAWPETADPASPGRRPAVPSAPCGAGRNRDCFNAGKTRGGRPRRGSDPERRRLPRLPAAKGSTPRGGRGVAVRRFVHPPPAPGRSRRPVADRGRGRLDGTDAPERRPRHDRRGPDDARAVLKPLNPEHGGREPARRGGPRRRTGGVWA